MGLRWDGLLTDNITLTKTLPREIPLNLGSTKFIYSHRVALLHEFASVL